MTDLKYCIDQILFSSDSTSSVRYTADYVREQLFVPPFHKVPAKEHAKQRKISMNTNSRKLRVRISLSLSLPYAY